LIISCSEFPEAKKPLYKLRINFGSEICTRNSSAQLRTRFTSPKVLLAKKCWLLSIFSERKLQISSQKSLSLVCPMEKEELLFSQWNQRRCISDQGFFDVSETRINILVLKDRLQLTKLRCLHPSFSLS